jgi:hypothetical protein
VEGWDAVIVRGLCILRCERGEAESGEGQQTELRC